MNISVRALLFFLLLLTVSLLNKLQAQVALGGELGYNIGQRFPSPSLGFRADFTQDDDFGLLLGLNYFLPYRFASSVTLASDDPFDPYLNVPSKVSISGIQLHSGYKKYLGGEYNAGPALYLAYGVGITILFYRETYEASYLSDYRAPQEFSNNLSRSASVGICGNALLGLDMPLKDQHFLYAEAGYSYSKQISTGVRYLPISSSFVFRAGYRFQLDK